MPIYVIWMAGNGNIFHYSEIQYGQMRTEVYTHIVEFFFQAWSYPGLNKFKKNYHYCYSKLANLFLYYWLYCYGYLKLAKFFDTRTQKFREAENCFLLVLLKTELNGAIESYKNTVANVLSKTSGNNLFHLRLQIFLV